MSRISLLIVIATGAIFLVLTGCSQGAQPAEEEESVPDDMLTLGAELYAANCQACHGDRQGEGGRPGVSPHNEQGHTWHHPDAQLKEWVLDGREFLGMPAWRDQLNEEEVEAILAFIKTWWTEEQRESQADISQRYQEALDRLQ